MAIETRPHVHGMSRPLDMWFCRTHRCGCQRMRFLGSLQHRISMQKIRRWSQPAARTCLADTWGYEERISRCRALSMNLVSRRHRWTCLPSAFAFSSLLGKCHLGAHPACFRNAIVRSLCRHSSPCPSTSPFRSSPASRRYFHVCSAAWVSQQLVLEDAAVTATPLRWNSTTSERLA